MEFGQGPLENLELNPLFWKDKKVLITGHTGFKGSWLSLILYSLGAKVFGYSLTPPSSPNLFELSKLESLINSTIGDIRSSKEFSTYLHSIEPDIILHLAAQSLVKYSYEHPVETYETNVMGTLNLLEGARSLNSVKAILIITSDKCYLQNNQQGSFTENHPLGGYDPYSSSKACAEILTSAYRLSFYQHLKRPVYLASARAGNVIGGGDWAKDRLIPDIIKAFHASNEVIIRSPHATRPWQHVLDPLNGYILLAENLYNQGNDFEGGWNLGPTQAESKPVSYIVEKMKLLWGDNATWKLDDKVHPHEAQELFLNSEKANRLLQWHNKLDIDTSLAWTCDWYKTYFKGADMQAVTLRQIAEYQQLIR